MLRIIPIVACLAQGSEVFGSAIFGDMVEVSYRKHNLNQLSLPIGYYGMIFPTTELAAVVSSFKYLLTYLLPVLRVSVSIFGSDWHSYSSSPLT